MNNRTEFIFASLEYDYFEIPFRTGFIWLIIYLVTLTIGLIENFLIIWTILTKSHLRSFINCLIANQAFVNLFFLTYGTIPETMFRYGYHLSFTKIYCLSPLFSYNASLFTLMVILFSACVSMKKPFNEQFSPLKSTLTIIFILVLSILIVTPDLNFLNEKYCSVRYPSIYLKKVFSKYIKEFGLTVFPVLVFLIMAIAIAIRLMTNMRSGDSKEAMKQNEILKSNQPKIKMSLVSMLMFLLMWSGERLKQELGPSHVSQPYIIYLLTYYAVILFSVIQPFIVINSNTELAGNIKQIFKRSNVKYEAISTSSGENSSKVP